MGTTLIGEPGGSEPRRAGTTLMGTPGGTRLATPLAEGEARTESAAPQAGPVVGWLVVIAGPGAGRSIELGYGLNIVGRGAGNRIVLDYGDDQISSEDHFRIAYDGAARRFHLVPGKGTNLVYVGGAPLLTPVELAPATDMTVGATTLRFVPLCGPDWDWPSAA